MSTSGARPRTRKSPQQRSAEIHEAAIMLAQEAGLSALTLRAVAARAAVAPGLVAHYASNMDDLVVRTFRELTTSDLNDVRAKTEIVSDPAARMARMIATVLSSEHNGVTLVWVDAWSLGRGSAALSVAIDEQMNAWQSFIAQIIAHGKSTGTFQTDHTDAVAWQILAMIDGVSAHALTRRTDGARFAERLAQACETLVGAAPGIVGQHLSPP
jgi:AcrR family transcriptional regulator